MKTLLLVLFLELLSGFHSSPLISASDIPEDSTEDSDFHEVVKEGYILPHVHPTTELPKRNATTKTSLRSLFESMNEGSGDITTTISSGSEHTTATTQSISESKTEGSGDFGWNTFQSIPEGSGDVTSTTAFFGGSEDITSTTVSRNEVERTTPSFIEEVIEPKGRQLQGAEPGLPPTFTTVQPIPSEPSQDEPPFSSKTSLVLGSTENETSSKDFIIIIGFAAGVATLVLVGAAIATKDKWYKQKKVFKEESKTGISNHVKELEMQTFLHNQEPKLNGKETEYTVIPLDDLPEKL